MLSTLLNDRYELEAELGGGGIGVVYRAHDLLLDREVAIKILNRASKERLGSEGRTRLFHEARAAARLSHPNIVAIHDVGESQGTPFIVMELVEGQPLSSGRAESLENILSVARQVCAALEHAHSNGIIHRDLKPENILITSQGGVKLMDFGLARLTRVSRTSSEGMIVGTVFYLSPEQALGQPADRRADLYALGVLLYELSTGRLPFEGDDPLVVISQHLHAAPASPRSLRAELPPALEAVILRLLSKDPDDRYATARQVAAALAALHPDSEAAVSPGEQPRGSPPNNLPLQLSKFIGREAEMQAVQDLLSTSRLVTLTGLGGSGKTRLALEVGASQLSNYPAGVWLVDLTPLADPGLVPQAVLSSLGIAEQAGLSILEMLTGYLRPRRLLLILDNCEHLVEACARLAGALLAACPGLTILSTSREAFNIAGESAWYVPALTAPDPQQLPEDPQEALAELARYESIHLFCDRARAVQPSFSLTPENARLVAQICYQLEGLPLAIELAAARMRSLSLEGIASRLSNRFTLLTGGSRTAPLQRQTLRATIDWSYELLTPAEKTTLARLSVFANSWSLSAAEAVCASQGDPDGPQPGEILDLLASLVNKSLITSDGGGDEIRYRMLETIRQYAREKLEALGEPAELQNRHLRFFLEASTEAENRFRSESQLTWLDWAETEHDNLRAALDWALHCQNPLDALELAGSLALFWYFRGYRSEGREWLERALAAAGSPGPDERSPELSAALVKALYGAAWLADESGDEIPLYERALAICRETGDRWGEAYCLRGLGSAAINKEDYVQAAELLEESLALFRQLESGWGTATALFNRGWLASNDIQAESLHRALSDWEEALRLFRESGDRWGQAVSLDALSFSARTEGDYARAAKLSKEALHLFKELGDKAGIAISLFRLGTVAYRREDYPQAVSLFEQSRSFQRELGYLWSSINSLRMLGLIACYQGDFERAEGLINEARIGFRGIDSNWGTGLSIFSLALTAYYRGELSRARSLLEESLNYLEESSDKPSLAAANIVLARITFSEGDFERAAGLIAESNQLNQEQGEKFEVITARVLLGRIKTAQGELEEAEDILKETFNLRRKMGAKRAIAESLEALAGLAVRQDKLERAARLLGAAETFREAAGAPLPPVERMEMEHMLASAGLTLDGLRSQASWAEGRAWGAEDPEGAFKYAMEKDQAH
jgi:non-specific serine/threonine protein kinase